MPNDALTLRAVTEELKKFLLGGKITKISQPEADEIILQIHNSKNYKLLISASASMPRIHLVTETKVNPLTSPNFCMQLRKHITNGCLTNIYQNGFERQIIIELMCKNELFDTVKRNLIVEIINRCGNIILTDENMKIIAINKSVTLDLSSIRQLLIGLKYENPPQQNKISLDDFDKIAVLLDEYDGQSNIFSYISNNVSGFAKSTLDEIFYLSDIDSTTNKLSEEKKSSIMNNLKSFVENVNCLNISPTLTTDEKYNPIEFSAFEYNCVRGLKKQQETLNETLEKYYSLKDKHERFLQHSKQLQTVVKNELKKNQKKLKIYLQKQEDCAEFEDIKIIGELLTSNLYKIKKGDDSITVENYYDENKQITIPLDKQLYPAQNAQKYFKLYSKKKKTMELVETQLEEINSKIEQLSEILDSFRKCTEVSEIEDIKNELIVQGFIKKQKEKTKQKFKTEFKFLKYQIEDFCVLVGKNNLQNDELTMKIAKQDDLWLHTKIIHGSHVIIQNPNNNDIPETVITKVAEIAAFFSKGFQSSKVEVDYTLRKYIKKPSGAVPGFVIYTNQKTISVSPDENLNLRV